MRLKCGGETLRVQAGDLLVLPHGDAHYLGSDLQLASVTSDTLVHAAPPSCLMRIDHGSGESTCFICGFLACDAVLCRPLLDALPHLLRVPLTQGADNAWMLGLMRHAAYTDTAAGPGAMGVMAKLAELLFLKAIRRHIALLPDRQTGWLAGLRDPYVGRTLNAMHADPMRA